MTVFLAPPPPLPIARRLPPELIPSGVTGTILGAGAGNASFNGATAGIASSTGIGVGEGVVTANGAVAGLVAGSILGASAGTASYAGTIAGLGPTVAPPPPPPVPPGQTFVFNPAYSEFMLEAFSRIQLRGAALSITHLVEARRSMNIMLQAWGNRGVNLWAVTQAVIPLVTNQAVAYALPANTIDVYDVVYNSANGDGTTTDRYLIPISRTDYAMLPNKTTPGTPTVYWIDRTLAPTITIWQPESLSPPNQVTIWYLRRLADVAAPQTGDLPPRFFEALCSDLAYRLAVKYPEALQPGQKAELRADMLAAWEEASREDREIAPLSIRPDLSAYWLN